jgi:predicted metal-dependent enzyme (double-stranded beta helix superfamily)
MPDRIRVTEAQLKAHWMSPDATGLIHDHQTDTKVVVMADGTEYETPWAEIEAAS